MFGKILEILIDKFIRPSSAAERAERRAKENLVYVHEALVRCHRSYVAFKASPTEGARAKWRSDTLRLAQCVDNARNVLATFGQVAYNNVVQYTLAEAVAPYDELTDHRMALEAGLFDIVDGLKLLKTDEQPHWDESFNSVAAKLRETIAKQLTPGEVQRAQDAFHKKRLSRFWRG